MRLRVDQPSIRPKSVCPQHDAKNAFRSKKLKYKLDKPLEFDRILWSLLHRLSLFQLEQMILQLEQWTAKVVLEQSRVPTEVAPEVLAVPHALDQADDAQKIEIELLLDEEAEVEIDPEKSVVEALVLAEFANAPEVIVVVLEKYQLAESASGWVLYDQDL